MNFYLTLPSGTVTKIFTSVHAFSGYVRGRRCNGEIVTFSDPWHAVCVKA
jgi:hypothetical protein